jgi:hypothetical protein
LWRANRRAGMGGVAHWVSGEMKRENQATRSEEEINSQGWQERT